MTNLVFAAACLAVAALTGHATVGNVTAVLCGIAGSYAVLIPLTLLRDKLDGTLAVLTALPVTTRTQAEARLFVALTLNGVGALQCAAAGALAVRSVVPLDAGRTVGVFVTTGLAAWIGLAGFSAVTIALLSRFSIEATTRLPGVVAATFFAAVWAGDHLLPPDTGPSLARLAAAAWALPVAIALSLAGFALLGSAAVHVTATGFARYQPPRVT